MSGSGINQWHQCGSVKQRGNGGNICSSMTMASPRAGGAINNAYIIINMARMAARRDNWRSA